MSKLILQCTFFLFFCLSISNAKQQTDRSLDNSSQLNHLQQKIFMDYFKYLPPQVQKLLNETKVHFHIQPDAKPDGLFYITDKNNLALIKYHIRLNSHALYRPAAYRLLIHEYFHLLHYLINPFPKSVWNNEGLALMFEYILTESFNANYYQQAIENQTPALFENKTIEVFTAIDYGNIMLYYYYLLRECGGYDLFWEIVYPIKSKSSGIKKIDQLLIKNNQFHHLWQCKNFKNNFISFNLSKIINQVNFFQIKNANQYYLDNNKYRIKQLKLNSPKRIPYFTPYKISYAQAKYFTNNCTQCQVVQVIKDYPAQVHLISSQRHLKNINAEFYLIKFPLNR